MLPEDVEDFQEVSFKEKRVQSFSLLFPLIVRDLDVMAGATGFILDHEAKDYARDGKSESWKEQDP